MNCPKTSQILLTEGVALAEFPAMGLGEVVKAARMNRGLTQAELGALIGADGQTISNIETGVTKTLKLSRMRKLAEIIGEPVQNLLEMAKDSNGHTRASIVAGIDPTSFEADVIPTWDLDVRASSWATVPLTALDPDNPNDQRVLARGLFRLRILGTCMLPRYRDGSVVEFQLVKIAEDPLEIGRDYVVCRNDDTATFKRLVAHDETTILLRALNQKHHPGEIRLGKQEIVRIAVAVNIVHPTAPGKIPKLPRVRRG